MAKEYWIKQKNQVKGPYSSSELKTLTSTSKIHPDDEISTDRVKWIKANRVKGLAFTDNDSERKSLSPKHIKKKYWIRQEGNVHGPYSSSELKELAKKRQITATSEISKDKKRWTTFGEIKSMKISVDDEEEDTHEETGILNFDAKHLVTKPGGHIWKPAKLYINNIGSKDWQFKLTAKELNKPITLTVYEFEENADISEDGLIIYLDEQEEEFSLPEDAIYAINNRLRYWKEKLSKQPTLCPRCWENKLERGSCSSCGYKKRGGTTLSVFKILLRIGAAMIGILFLFGGISMIFSDKEIEDKGKIITVVFFMASIMLSYAGSGKTKHL